MISSSHGQEAQEATQPSLPNLQTRCTCSASFPTIACPRLMRKSPMHGELHASAVPKPALLASPGSQHCHETEQSHQTIMCNSACKQFPHLGLLSQSSKYNCKHSSAQLRGPQRIGWARLSTQLLGFRYVTYIIPVHLWWFCPGDTSANKGKRES